MTNPIRHFFEGLSDRLAPKKEAIGKLTMACSMGLVFLGLPAQIYANYEAQRCGQNPMMSFLILAVYAFRLPYQISVKAWWLLPSDIVGLMTSAILMAQYFIY